MRVGLGARLMAGYLALVIVVGGATLVVIERSLADALVAELDARLVAQARAVSQWLDKAGRPDKLAPRLAWVTAAEVTIIGADGVIQGDSSGGPDSLGRPIGDAPEVAAARRTGIGRARRQLLAGGPPMYMVAYRTADGGTVRVAVPLSSVATARSQLRGRLAVAGAIGLVAALLLGLATIRVVTRPLQAMTRTAERLARGDYEVPPPEPGAPRDELALLSRTLAQLAGEIKARVGDLTAERDLSAAVVEALVEGVFAVDAAGRVVLANRAATMLVGEVGGDALPSSLAQIVSEARGGAVRDAEIDVAGRMVRVTARPLAAAGGVVAVLYDVTQLRALDRVRRDFLASAAHELRTPVTAISGYAETLLGGQVDDAAAREFLATIHRNAGRITRLVNDLLELERLEARPERIVERVPVPLQPLVAHAAATARAVATDVRLDVDVAADAIVLGDQDGLEHVVQNLVDNAVLHGGGAVQVAARRDGRKVVLTVSDDGPGIPADKQARIFERFYRVDPGRNRSRGGSGLGLAIVEQQVAAMGGAVSVTSAAGQGATFTVTLDAA